MLLLFWARKTEIGEREMFTNMRVFDEPESAFCIRCVSFELRKGTCFAPGRKRGGKACELEKYGKTHGREKGGKTSGRVDFAFWKGTLFPP